MAMSLFVWADFVRQLRSVFLHIPVRAHNAATVSMLQVCLAAVEDEDHHVRMLFS